MSKLLKLIFLLVAATFCNGERTKDKMYKPINVVAPCFRRLNATHQTGCSSTRTGSTGVVHFITEKKDIHFIIENGTAGPYIPVMPITLLTLDVAFLLRSSDKISGLVTFQTNESRPDHYSHESTCPNSQSSLSNTCTKTWNPFGTGLLNEDFPFPIFYLTEEDDIQKIKDCFKKFNDFSYETHYDRSLCSLELNSFMLATTDTPTCIRRSHIVTNFNPVKFCDPLGDENIWASLFPLANTTEIKLKNNMKYIIIAAHLDSTSLFLDVVPGANNPITGVVALLTTAKLLKHMLPIYDSTYEQNVLFVLFNGESYDYIGSQRMVYDMGKDEFPTQFNTSAEFPVNPINIEDVSLFIEFGQLSNSKNLNIFSPNKTRPEYRDFLSRLKKYAGVDFINETADEILPPASLQSFVKARPNISGLILADHNDAYKNHFYNSIFDNASNINFQYYNQSDEIPTDSVQYFLGNISNYVALSVYEQITNSKFNGPDYYNEAAGIANEFLNCYLLSSNCKVNKAIQKKRLQENPYGLYVSVSVTRNIVTMLTGLTMGWITGDIVKDEPCSYGMKSHIYQYYNMSKDLDDLNKTVCYRTTFNFSDAVSPAFIIDGYDWSSGQYSSWSESAWRDIHVRLFLKPSSAHEHMTIAIGSLVLVFSFVAVYFIKTRAHILFAPPLAVSPTSC